MEIYNLYENVLREEEISNKAQSCVKVFGNELFGNELGGTEKNTNIEDKFAYMITNFTVAGFGRDMSYLNPTFIAAINKLKSCMGSYPEILVPENTTVYRGTKILLTDWLKGYVPNQRIFKYVYKAKSYIQSWSEEYKVANLFGSTDPPSLTPIIKWFYDAHNTDEERLIDIETLKPLLINAKNSGVILYKANPNQFLFKSKYFDKLSGHGSEHEILRIGNEPLNCLASFGDYTGERHENIFNFLIKHKNKLDII